MLNCYIYSLGLLYTTHFNENYLYNNPYLKDLINGSINFALNNLNKDGSYDEHYHNEHSVAATCFALYHISETFLITSIDLKKYVEKLKRVSEFLIKNEEYFTRSNHIACIVLALYNVYILTNENKYKFYSDKFLKKLYQNFSDEGWFIEYNGFDPGYSTFTLYFLSKYAQKTENIELEEKLKKLVVFCSNFIHPDGSYGGFYGSRENQHFLPVGFERTRVQNDIGTKLVNNFLINLNEGNVELMSDDRFNFLLFNNLLELLNILSDQRTKESFEIDTKSALFDDAGIYIMNNEKFSVILSLKKGGVLYVFKDNQLIFRSCGIVGKSSKGIISSIGYSNVKYSVIENGFIIMGKFKKGPQQIYFNSLRSILFTIYISTLGRFKFLSKFLKKKMIKTLILNENPVNVNFKLEIKFQEQIDFSLTIDKKKNVIFQDLYLSSYFPNMYVPSSRFFQKNDSLIKDIIFKKELETLNQNNTVKILITL